MIGDPAGPELHTHQAHYQGEIAVRMALGDDVAPDYRALPRATYMDPEAASVGLTPDQAATAGLDAFELVADFATSARGYGVEATLGHVTILVDRASRTLIGAAMACPDASAAIHECVLAIKARVPIEVLADTIHAFPSTSRILNGLFDDAAERLAGAGRPDGSRLEGDLAVDQDEPGPDGGEAARRVLGRLAGRGREDDEVGPHARRRAVRGPARGPSPTGPIVAARSACSRVRRLLRPERRRVAPPPRVAPEDGHRDARPRVDRLDRRVRPEGEDRAGLERGSARGRPSASARSPQSRRAVAASSRRWTGWTEAAIPPAANRPRSSGWRSWTCSRRGMRATRSTVGSRASSAARAAASPIAWTWVAIPASAARSASSREELRGHPEDAAVGVRARPAGSRSAAVCDPSVPSAKSLSQPTCARPSRPRTRARPPLRRPRSAAQLEALRAEAGVDADRQLAARRPVAA